MRFVFTGRFYVLLGFGIVPLSLSWSMPALGYAVMVYDVALMLAAIYDYASSRKDLADLTVSRTFDQRFAIGDENVVRLTIDNRAAHSRTVIVKDEHPAGMVLLSEREATIDLPADTNAAFEYRVRPPRRGRFGFGRTAVRVRSRLGLVWCQSDRGEPQDVKVYPSLRRAREAELQALGPRSFLSAQRRSLRRGEGREFESMRDYVRGDELRHISWTATARRSRLTTRQYQIERDQTVIVAIDSGRLMTGRIGTETKFDIAVQSMLSLLSASFRAGDSCGVVAFGRHVRQHLPPGRGPEHIDAVLDALHDIEPEMLEPSYSRAFQFIASTVKKRSLVVILTDVVDKDSSKDLIRSLKLLRPRHLPVVVTIADRDLKALISRPPDLVRELYEQSAAEEVLHHREAALKLVESLGGLAVDVTVENVTPRLLETYLRVKRRGLL